MLYENARWRGHDMRKMVSFKCLTACPSTAPDDIMLIFICSFAGRSEAPLPEPSKAADDSADADTSLPEQDRGPHIESNPPPNPDISALVPTAAPIHSVVPQVDTAVADANDNSAASVKPDSHAEATVALPQPHAAAQAAHAPARDAVPNGVTKPNAKAAQVSIAQPSVPHAPSSTVDVSRPSSAHAAKVDSAGGKQKSSGKAKRKHGDTSSDSRSTKEQKRSKHKAADMADKDPDKSEVKQKIKLEAGNMVKVEFDKDAHKSAVKQQVKQEAGIKVKDEPPVKPSHKQTSGRKIRTELQLDIDEPQQLPGKVSADEKLPFPRESQNLATGPPSWGSSPLQMAASLPRSRRKTRRPAELQSLPMSARQIRQSRRAVSRPMHPSTASGLAPLIQ